MKECTDFEKRVRCPRNSDLYCRNMTVQVYVKLLKQNITAYERGCASHDECVFKKCTSHFAEPLGENPDAYNFCRMSCCQENLCPEGNVTKVEGPVKGARQSGADGVNLKGLFVTAGAMLNVFMAFLQ